MESDDITVRNVVEWIPDWQKNLPRDDLDLDHAAIGFDWDELFSRLPPDQQRSLRELDPTAIAHGKDDVQTTLTFIQLLFKEYEDSLQQLGVMVLALTPEIDAKNPELVKMIRSEVRDDPTLVAGLHDEIWVGIGRALSYQSLTTLANLAQANRKLYVLLHDILDERKETGASQEVRLVRSQEELEAALDDPDLEHDIEITTGGATNEFTITRHPKSRRTVRVVGNVTVKVSGSEGDDSLVYAFAGSHVTISDDGWYAHAWNGCVDFTASNKAHVNAEEGSKVTVKDGGEANANKGSEVTANPGGVVYEMGGVVHEMGGVVHHRVV